MTPNDYLIGAELASETHLGIGALLPFHSFFFHLQLDPAFLMGLSLAISCSHSAPLAGYFLFTLCPVCCSGWWGFFVWCVGWFCVCMCLPSHGILRLLSSAGWNWMPRTSALQEIQAYIMHSYVFSWLFCIIHVLSFFQLFYFFWLFPSVPAGLNSVFTAVPLPFCPPICHTQLLACLAFTLIRSLFFYLPTERINDSA